MKIAVFLFIIVILVILVYKIYKKDDIINVVSSVDNKVYQVRNTSSILRRENYTGDNTTNNNTIRAVEYLSELNKRVNILIDYMVSESLPNIVSAHRLKSRWSQCNLRETSIWDDSIAFTVNKGKEIRICIRDSSGSEFEEINTSMFVILHEIAHVMSESYGHNDEFNDNFKYITHLASYLGLYKPENFEESPKTYCGFPIRSTPCSEGTCVYNDI